MAMQLDVRGFTLAHARSTRPIGCRSGRYTEAVLLQVPAAVDPVLEHGERPAIAEQQPQVAPRQRHAPPLILDQPDIQHPDDTRLPAVQRHGAGPPALAGDLYAPGPVEGS